jgi:hypothetical protein
LKRLFIILFCCVSQAGYAQTLGGNAVFNFMQQPNNAQLSALGGVNISNITNDVGMSFHNPSLLREKHHTQVSTAFNLFVGGIKSYGITSGYNLGKYNTNVGIGISYFDYGSTTTTDASGNVLGEFKPQDYLVQLMASRSYKEHWQYGATIKFINSSYGIYKSSGIAVDAGVTYADTTHLLQASVVVKNIGTQLKAYTNNNPKEELPFDFQAGITKRLVKAPLQFSITAHHLHRFNMYYSDTAFLASEGEDSFRGKAFTFSKILSHLVLSTQLYLKDKVEITAGYNFLRRKDLNVLNAANGLNGITIGAGLLLNDLQIRYATGFYQQNMFNQLQVNFSWK